MEKSSSDKRPLMVSRLMGFEVVLSPTSETDWFMQAEKPLMIAGPKLCGDKMGGALKPRQIQ
jgi:hypothetical protein